MNQKVKTLKYTQHVTFPKIERHVNEGNEKMFMKANVDEITQAGTRDCRGQVQGGHHYCL